MFERLLSLFQSKPDQTPLPEPDARLAMGTLLVQVAKRASAEDLYLYCTRNVGKINKMMFFHNESSKSFSVRKKKIARVAFFKL